MIFLDQRLRKKSKVEREYRNLRHCLSNVYQSDGMKGYYSGIKVAIFSIGVYRSIFFGMYEVNKLMFDKLIDDRVFMKEKHTAPIYIKFLLAQVSVTMGAAVCYPFDTVTRRMMIDSGRIEQYRTNYTIVQTFQSIYKREGMKGFYRVKNCRKGHLPTKIIKCFLGSSC